MGRRKPASKLPRDDEGREIPPSDATNRRTIDRQLADALLQDPVALCALLLIVHPLAFIAASEVLSLAGLWIYPITTALHFSSANPERKSGR